MISLNENDLTGWDFSGQDLTDASFGQATLTNANLTGVDTRGAVGLNFSGTVSRNSIVPDGKMNGLTLTAGERLLIRDDDGVTVPPPKLWVVPRPPIPVTIKERFNMEEDSVLQLLFESDQWDSLISFEPGIPVKFGGTLELTFADDVELASQVGRTLRIFDWTGVSPSGLFEIRSPYVWDITHLYTTGEVTLVAVPEPTSGLIVLAAVLTLVAHRKINCLGLRQPVHRKRVTLIATPESSSLATIVVIMAACRSSVTSRFL
jgi:hypothetical protein